MSAKLDGTNGVVFPDGTTQGTAGIASTSNQLAKAWVNFNGITTASIRASYNVSSVTRNGTGDYTINFTNAMTDANYVVAGCVNRWSTTRPNALMLQNTPTITASAVQVLNVDTADSSFRDSSYIFVAIFR